MTEADFTEVVDEKTQGSQDNEAYEDVDVIDIDRHDDIASRVDKHNRILSYRYHKVIPSNI